MITNFHLPKSSLLIMICAFGGIYDLMMEAYEEAVEKKNIDSFLMAYAMLIL